MGVAGLTFATGENRLLSELYLDRPIEEVLSEAVGRNGEIERPDIVEIGPLASTLGGLGEVLMRILPIIIWTAGAQAAVCTVTADLARRIEGHGVGFQTIGKGDINRIPADQRASWGAYYAADPQVICADVSALAETVFGSLAGHIAARV